MILVQIVTVVCQDHVRNKFFLQFFKLHLYSRMKRWEEAVAITSDCDLLGLGSFQEQARTFHRLPFPYRIRAEHVPIDFAFRILPQQLQDRSAASNLVCRLLLEKKKKPARGLTELTESKS